MKAHYNLGHLYQSIDQQEKASNSYQVTLDLCDDALALEPNNEEEHTPQLFSNENETQIENNLDDSNGNLNDSHGDEHTEKLFDQDSNEEEDFEIPAFLRKQKF